MQAPELILEDDEDEDNTRPTLLRTKKTDVYALGMVCFFFLFIQLEQVFINRFQTILVSLFADSKIKD